MLVLSRVEGQTLEIGGNVVIRIVSLRKGSVRIGIEADKSIKVLRGEINNGQRQKGDVAVDAGDNDQLSMADSVGNLKQSLAKRV